MRRHAPSIGIGLGLSLRSQGPGFSGLLDQFGGAAAAYSLRALTRGWLAGDVDEVRRSSDSTSDTFTAGQITNGDLVAFCGVGDGFVSTWYDQSGNANNATQGTTTAQPKIVSAGVLDVDGMDFDGVDDALDFTQVDLGTGDFFCTSAFTWGGGNGVILGGGTQGWVIRPVTSTSASIRTSNTSVIYNFSLDTTLVSGTQYVVSVFRVGNDISMAINGSVQSDVETVLGTDEFATDKIGWRTSTNFFDDSIAEVNIWDSNQSANQAAIDANLVTYYGI